MRLEYLPPINLEHHFIGFSRFEKMDSVSVLEWEETVAKVKEVVVPALEEKVRELKIAWKPYSSSASRSFKHFLDKTEVGVGIGPLPPKMNDPYKNLCREKVNKVNNLAFKLLSKMSDHYNHNIYLKLCAVGTMYPPIVIGLKDQCKLVVCSLPTESIESLPKPLYREIKNIINIA